MTLIAEMLSRTIVLILNMVSSFQKFQVRMTVMSKRSKQDALAEKTKKNKSVSDIFCVSGKCLSHKVNHSSTRSCRCYNCKNTSNSNEVVMIKKESEEML